MASPRDQLSILGRSAATFDRAVLAAVRLRNKNRHGRAESLSHDERMEALAWIESAYAAPEIWASPDAFFAPPAPIAPALARVRGWDARTRVQDGSTRGSGEVLDASWTSEFEPYLGDMRDKYLAHEANRTAHARLYFGKGKPRPAVVLVHGYLAGQWAIEERAWPIEWLSRRFDLALVLLPFHALRARTDKSGPPPFPGADPRFTIEGFRQAMLDVRALVRWLRARGAPSVGIMGMSLGGYTTALTATVEPGLAFAAPIIPLASLADFALEQGRLGSGDDARRQHAALEAAQRIVSPFARPSLVAKERVLVTAARADRITPIAHAERLAEHLGARLVRFEGGHLLQFGRAEAFRTIGRWLGTLDLGA
jgi:pimeloyl-ACP methyl ester carboxylesterase